MSEENAVLEATATVHCGGCGEELSDEEIKSHGGELCDICMYGNSSIEEVKRDEDGGAEKPKPIPGNFTQTSLTLKEGLTQKEWVEVGRSLRSMERGIQFWVGDWLAYGEARFGEEAFADLERRDKTLANWATVARKVAPSRRREDVQFSHHAEVASLPPAEQTEVLEEVKENHYTVGQTRDRVREKQQARAETDAAQNGRRTQQEKIYEYCGCCGAPESAWSHRPHEVADGS